MSSSSDKNASTLTHPLIELHHLGQSVWLDYIRRSLMESGELQRLVKEDGLAGLTSNPSIFEKAITGSADYSDFLTELQQRKDLDAKAVYEQLVIRDIQDAADVLRPVYDETKFRDGYVSLEVSPFLAHDTPGTLEEARRLWKAVGRENLMIKVPGTPEGLPAIEQLLSEGINVNITLLFAQEVYEKVALAYISALEKRAAQNEDLRKMASVASFFVSRIDTLMDNRLKARLKTAQSAEERKLLESLQGKTAIANAKLAYRLYQELIRSPRWAALEKKGAQTQRLLWASTSTKDPRYRDVLYVEELIGPDTVNTIPPATLDAFRDHGIPRLSLGENVEGAAETMAGLTQAGISLTEVTDELVRQGVKLFAEAFDQLLNAVDTRCKIAVSGDANPQSYSLPPSLAPLVEAAIDDWEIGGKVRRLWGRDASLWTNSDEANWLGWLGETEDQLAHKSRFENLAAEVREAGFKDSVLLGMGGSSLCADVLVTTFGKTEGFPQLHVLDSTDPAQIKAIEAKIDIVKTLFIVSSKSGSTLEPNIFHQYFFERAKRAFGEKQAGSRFIAITDPGSHLEQVAKAQGFRHIFHGVPSIGGRYSALSDFGMIPAAVMGIDAPHFLDRSDVMAVSCSYCVPIRKNPGVMLGLILGALGKHGRDKVTFIRSWEIRALGAWLEQLIAESTGKGGKGLVPVARDYLEDASQLGDDRVYIYLHYTPAERSEIDAHINRLEEAGQPVIRIEIADKMTLGQEFFRWEIATAVAGSILGVNAFNQPDVEASKGATRKLTSEYEKSGALPAETPFFQASGIKLFADEANAAALRKGAGGNGTLASYLAAHFNRVGKNDYVALLAYVEMSEKHRALLNMTADRLASAKGTPACVEFGPRFLHSTGQLYKGGPNSGVFLQITCDDAVDLPVPGQRYTFGVVKAAQARGDFEVLAERKRRALRIHIGKDVEAGLKNLESETRKALAK